MPDKPEDAVLESLSFLGIPKTFMGRLFFFAVGPVGWVDRVH